MGRLRVKFFLGLFLPVFNPPDKEPYKKAEKYEACKVRRNLPEGVGEQYLRLNVVGLKGFKVYGRLRYLEGLPYENKGVLAHNGFQGVKFKVSGHQGGDLEIRLYVVARNGVFPGAYLYGVQLPV